MVVALCMDMEGVSQITAPPQVFPWRAEYWGSGRQLFTADAVAAVEGLLSGGASEVLVIDNHFGTDQRNLIADEMPSGSRIVEWDVFDLAGHELDATFQVGRHARCGIADGFMSHTFVRDLRLRVGDELVSESHMLAWAADAPLLGIVGNAALGRSLGSLSGAPFLAVQESRERGSASPLFEPSAGLDEIRGFAELQMRCIGDRERFRPPTPTVVSASVATGDQAASALEAAGWQRTSDTVFVVEINHWSELAEPFYAARGAAVAPSGKHLIGLDLSTPDIADAENRSKTRAIDEVGMRWATESQPEWVAG